MMPVSRLKMPYYTKLNRVRNQDGQIALIKTDLTKKILNKKQENKKG